MVITRTPLRVSFVGGGTDLPEYYLNATSPGRVFSSTINKYVYIILNRKFDDKIRISYSQTENVDCVDDIQHDIVRNTMKKFNMTGGWEIVSVADIPGSGSGLGSSSAFTVGLIRAIMYELLDMHLSPLDIAEMAFDIEHNMCGKYCGKQDQLAASFGGMRTYEFFDDGGVAVCTKLDTKTRKSIQESSILFYLGEREDRTILKRQTENTPEKMGILNSMAMLAKELKSEIVEYPCQVGQYLDINWEYKRQLVDGISNDNIQGIYQRAMGAGANGGKVLGQGGGGFMLFHAKPEIHQAVKDAVGLKSVPFRFTGKGTEVIYGA